VERLLPNGLRPVCDVKNFSWDMVESKSRVWFAPPKTYRIGRSTDATANPTNYSNTFTDQKI
jgi:hypothetical protein